MYLPVQRFASIAARRLTRLLAILVLAASLTGTAQAQDSAARPLRVALLAPLYLDSAFSGSTYQLGNGPLPRYLLPGLEFYNGAMLAVDSLKAEQAALQVWVYDTKKAGQPIGSLLYNMEQQHFSLIIASLTNPDEQKQVSDFSFRHNIPVVSATYPNDAGVLANPFFIRVNASLRTHVEGMYQYIHRSFPADKILYVTRKGQLEDRILAEFSAADPRYRLRYKVAQLPDGFTAEQLLPLLDSTRQNIVVCGSLNESFGTTLLNLLCAAGNYRTIALGMPTWDGLKAAYNTTCTQLDIVYSTPYRYSRTDAVGASLVKKYRDQLAGKPSDMVFKGFECMYHFSKLLLTYHNDFINHVSDNLFLVANSFLFEPVRLSNTSFAPDYLENKKLYFVRLNAGTIKSVN